MAWGMAGMLASLPALAAGQDAGKPLCDGYGTQQELNDCAADRLAAADQELNTIWRQVLDKQQGDALAIAKLKAAQRLWIQLRDADLAAQFPLAEGENPRIAYGSIYPLEFAGAREQLTRERTRYLQATWLTPSGN